MQWIVVVVIGLLKNLSPLSFKQLTELLFLLLLLFFHLLQLFLSFLSLFCSFVPISFLWHNFNFLNVCVLIFFTISLVVGFRVFLPVPSIFDHCQIGWYNGSLGSVRHNIVLITIGLVVLLRICIDIHNLLLVSLDSLLHYMVLLVGNMLYILFEMQFFCLYILFTI